MFIDILIVSILSTVRLVPLMRSICQLQRFSDLIVHLKPQTNTTDKGVVLLETKDKTQFLQWVCGSLKNCWVFWGEYAVFCSELKKMAGDSVL